MKRNGEKRAADIAQLGEYFPSFQETLGRPPTPPPAPAPAPAPKKPGVVAHATQAVGSGGRRMRRSKSALTA